MLLWLWYRPAAVAPIGPLAWEPPYASGGALKKKKVLGHTDPTRPLPTEGMPDGTPMNKDFPCPDLGILGIRRYSLILSVLYQQSTGFFYKNMLYPIPKSLPTALLNGKCPNPFNSVDHAL